MPNSANGTANIASARGNRRRARLLRSAGTPSMYRLSPPSASAPSCVLLGLMDSGTHSTAPIANAGLYRPSRSVVLGLSASSVARGIGSNWAATAAHSSSSPIATGRTSRGTP